MFSTRDVGDLMVSARTKELSHTTSVPVAFSSTAACQRSRHRMPEVLGGDGSNSGAKMSRQSHISWVWVKNGLPGLTTQNEQITSQEYPLPGEYPALQVP